MTTARERADDIVQSPAWWGRKRVNGPIWVDPAALADLVTAAIEAAEQAAREAEREACARIAEKAFGGPAHTYASENADLYRAQDGACELIASRIRARPSPPDPAG